MTMATATHATLVKNAFAGAPGMLMTGLMDVYFKCGKVKLTVRVFEKMPERDVIAWGSAIAGFAHKGVKREALELRCHCYQNFDVFFNIKSELK